MKKTWIIVGFLFAMMLGAFLFAQYEVWMPKYLEWKFYKEHNQMRPLNFSPKELVELREMQEKAKINTSIVTSMKLIRTEGELFYDRNDSSYTGFCDAIIKESDTPIQIHDIESMVGDSRKVVCKSTKDYWVAEAPLLPSDYFCIDSTGATVQKGKALGAATACQ